MVVRANAGGNAPWYDNKTKMFYIRTDLVIGAPAPLLVTEELENLGES